MDNLKNRLRKYGCTVLWVTWVALTPTGAVRAALQIELEVSSHTEAPPGARNMPADSRTHVDLLLRDDAIFVRSPTREVLFDFRNRRRIEVDSATRQRVDYSLYDLVGFRSAELRNRLMMGQMLAAAKIAEAPPLGPTVEVEHALAIQNAPSSPLQTRQDDGFEVFLNGEKTMFRRSLQGTPVEPKAARMFAQFMRYTYGGHPQVLEAVASAPAIAQQYTLVIRTIGVTTIELMVRSVRFTEAPLPVMSDVPIRKATTPGLDSIDQVLDRGAALSAADLALARQRAQRALEAAVDEGRALDALLGVLEANLMTGQPLGIAPRTKELLGGSVDVQRVVTALAPRSREDLPRAIATFTDLRGATSKPYLMDLFTANDRAMLGDPAAARPLFIAALVANPALAGAYKDLGDNLYQTFDTPRAWRAWDIGRTLAPDLYLFRPVTQFEENLAKTHPEYF